MTGLTVEKSQNFVEEKKLSEGTLADMLRLLGVAILFDVFLHCGRQGIYRKVGEIRET